MRDINTHYIIGDEIAVDDIVEGTWKQGFAVDGRKRKIKYVIGDIWAKNSVVQTAHNLEVVRVGMRQARDVWQTWNLNQDDGKNNMQVLQFKPVQWPDHNIGQEVQRPD